MIEFKKNDSFFDYWHFTNIDLHKKLPLQKTAQEIAEKLKLQQVYTELPDHCFQLLCLS